MARFEIILSTKGPRNGKVLPGGASKVSRLKAILAGFLTFSIVAGLLIAALVVGSLIAALILIAVALVFVFVVIKMTLRRIRR